MLNIIGKKKKMNVPKLRIYFENNSSSINNSIQSILGVNKTCVPPLTHTLLLSSLLLSGEVHCLNEMVTEFMKHQGECPKNGTLGLYGWKTFLFEKVTEI